jgi:hypothetical protein
MSVVAGKTITSICDRFCISSFRKKCTLEKRTLGAPKTGQTQVTMSFTIIHTAYYNITTLKGTGRIGGVNIDKAATHFFMTPWRSSLNSLDGEGEHFIRYNSKLYRVLEITNINEYNTYMLFQVEERGLDSSEESDA